MQTKAVHLEAVTDLSTESFISTFKRFIGHYGNPSHMYSDCGSNFKRANKELEAYVRSYMFNKEIFEYFSESKIEWHFNPPASPHHGGIWEAAVKSAKFHLQRIVGNATLTLEEFMTLLCQVKAALNSRPLVPLSTKADDYGVLTPGHFLIGRPPLALPFPDVTNVQINRLSRWNKQEKMFQTFWSIWSKQYLFTLQQRTKWTKINSDLNLGDLVAIKEDNLPPLKWKLGRISELHPGPDGLIRVITVQTQNGPLKRPVVKIVQLLSNENLINPQ